MLAIDNIYEGLSQEVLKSVDDNSADLCITSPPYKDIDGFSFLLINKVFSEVYRILKPNGLLFLNFGHLAEDKMRPYHVCLLMHNLGFNLNETFIWSKNHFSPIRGKKRVNNLTEFIWLFYKKKMPDLDRLSIGVPYKDESNAKRFNNGLNLRCRGNLWDIPYQTINNKEDKLHNDRFPLALPEFCIKLSGVKKDSLIIEPFSGSGTTALAAKNLGMHYIAIDKDPKYVEKSRNRVK